MTNNATTAARVERLVGRLCSVTLYLADCHDLLPIEADAVVSDPPYGVNQNSNYSNRLTGIKSDGRFLIGDDFAFDPHVWLSYPTVVLFGANHYANRLPSSPRWLVWDKRDSGTSDCNADCEFVWTNAKGPARLLHHRWRGMIKDSEQDKTRLHPTQKPIAVMSWVMEQAKVPDGATVLDPFMGSGTTGVACIRTGRNFIGVEKDEKYFEVALKRLRAEINQGRMF